MNDLTDVKFSSIENFKKRNDLKVYKSEAWPLFALELYFRIENIQYIASTSITDGKNDRKCDLIYIDKENKRGVIIQSYFAEKISKIAKTNKASDLNTAVGWVLSSHEEQIPKLLLPRILELRNAILDNEIEQLDVWYIHNCHEHSRVQSEMEIVGESAKALLERHFSGSTIKVSSKEIGIETIEEWYDSSSAKILVTDEFEIETAGGYFTQKDTWEVFSTAISGKWIHKMFKQYDEKLFSANIRNYLGSINTKYNINNGIKTTLLTEPSNFLVFNNGITALVNDIEISKKTRSQSPLNQKIIISGISIVNGAQTTGAIGALEEVDETTLIPVRFIKSKDGEVIDSIIRFNNSQNAVTVSDFRSTDFIQDRVKKEFKAEFPTMKYLGGRRGGTDDVIKRIKNLVVSDQVAQSLTAFHGNPTDATHSKSKIWANDDLYSNVFNENTKASHIVFVYSLFKSLVEYKQVLKDKSKENGLTSSEEDILNFFSYAGSIYLIINAISETLEEIIERKVSSKFSISFKESLTLEEYVENWKEIIPLFISFSAHMKEALDSKVKVHEDIKKSIEQFRSLVVATRGSNKEKYDNFKKLVKYN